jgi:hypothetical protein
VRETARELVSLCVYTVCANPDPCGPGKLTAACAAVVFGLTRRALAAFQFQDLSSFIHSMINENKNRSNVVGSAIYIAIIKNIKKVK